MAAVDGAIRLLDFNEKLDIHLLDRVVASLYNGAGEEVGNVAHAIRDENATRRSQTRLIRRFVCSNKWRRGC